MADLRTAGLEPAYLSDIKFTLLGINSTPLN
jgi:hypothetical protein